jgi:hypothetical protein
MVQRTRRFKGRVVNLTFLGKKKNDPHYHPKTQNIFVSLVPSEIGSFLHEYYHLRQHKRFFGLREFEWGQYEMFGDWWEERAAIFVMRFLFRLKKYRMLQAEKCFLERDWGNVNGDAMHYEAYCKLKSQGYFADCSEVKK